MQKVLIIGGGYLSSVLSSLYQPTATVTVKDYPEVDLTNRQSLEAAIQSTQPDLIINAAAWTDTNAAELSENQAKVLALNVQGPLNLQLAARAAQIPWVHFSTAMMFDGQGDKSGWTETDTPSPTNFYSWSKAWADFALLPFCQIDQIWIFRIHTPIAALAHPRNFFNRMQNFDKFIDEPSSLTVLEDLFMAIETVRQQNAPGGIYNAVNAGTMSAFEIAQAMQKHGLITADKSLGRLNREELDTATKAKGGAHQTFPIMNTAKLAQAGFQFPAIQDSLEKTIKAATQP